MKRPQRLSNRILEAIITALVRANADDLSDLSDDEQEALSEADAWAKSVRNHRATRKAVRR